MNKTKWKDILPIILYLLGAVFFISYIYTQSVMLMCFGALCLCYGSMAQHRNTKDDSDKK